MSQAEVRISAPGKIILHGEHSVVYGTKAIAVSVGLLTTVTIVPNKSNQFHVKFLEVGMDCTFSLDIIRKLKAELRPDFKYEILNANDQIPIWEEVQSVFDKFCDSDVVFAKVDDGLAPVQKLAFKALMFLYLAIFEEPVGMIICAETEAPVGAGLGSSASFAVALAGALLVSGKIIPSKNPDKELINRWAFVCEKFIHGTPSGVDNTVATYGAGVIFQKGKDVELIQEFPDIRVLLVNTKVSRSTKVLVAKVASLKETDAQLFGTCMDGMESVVNSAIVELKEKKNVCPDLIAKNHECLKKIGVSHLSLEIIIELAQKNGFAGKLTGAGGGGCAFIFIPNNALENSVQSMKNALEVSGFEFWDTRLGCPGLTIY